MDKLHNCPNCGGYLNDSGRCEFCGSKVYDFVNIDYDKGGKTYLKVKQNGKIITIPMIFRSVNCTVRNSDVIGDRYMDGSFARISRIPEIEGSLDFVVVGDIIYEKDN